MIKEKIAIPIPETLLMKIGGNLRMWVFNSSSQTPAVILKKKSSKLFINEGLAKIAFGKKPPQNISTVFQLIDLLKPRADLYKSLTFFYRLTSGDGYISTAEAFIKRFQEKNSDISYIAKMVNIDHSDDVTRKRKVFTTYCCNYTQKQYNPPNFNFYTKTTLLHKKSKQQAPPNHNLRPISGRSLKNDENQKEPPKTAP
jgi:hypothetical protein